MEDEPRTVDERAPSRREADAADDPETAPAPAPDPGRYRRGAEIARGGMGRVVEAEDAVLGRTVALKETLEVDDDARKRFEREVRITARLEHPSIVPVYDAGRTPAGLPFYVMRRLTGRPLDQIIRAASTLDERLTFVPNLLSVLDAVGHAHRRGIIHRDLKPANVLIGDLGETVVIDWGLAKVIGEAEIALGQPLPALGDALTDATVAGTVVGTPGFMPPEQAAGTGVDARSDVYALGATLYQLLAGRPAYAGTSASEIIDRAIAAPPPALAGVVPGVPRELATIVGTAMAHAPADRYADAAEMGEDLRRFLSGRLVAAHHYSPRERLVRYIRRNRTILSVVVLAVVAVAVVATLSLRRILADRDRIASARATAEARRAEAEARSRELRALADGLILDQARLNLATDPTLAVALLKRLPADSAIWPAARAVVAEARVRGIAYALPGHAGIVSTIDIAGDQRHLLTIGMNDGLVRVHDLEARTTATIGRGIVARDQRYAWAGASLARLDLGTHELALLDPDTGAVRRVLSTTALWLDASDLGSIAWPEADGTVRWLRVNTTDPEVITTSPGLDWVQVSPGGEWVVLERAGTGGASRRDLIYQRTSPGQWKLALDIPEPRAMIVFAYDDTAAAYYAQSGELVELDLSGPMLHETRRVAYDKLLELGYAGTHLWTKVPDDHRLSYRDRTISRGSEGPPLAVLPATYGPTAAFGHGALAIAGATTAGRIVLTSPGRTPSELFAVDLVQRVYAQPGCKWVVGVAGGHILVWNLEDVLPRRLENTLSASFLQTVGPHHVLAGDFAMSRVLDMRTALFQTRESILGAGGLVVDQHHGVVVRTFPDRTDVIDVDAWTTRRIAGRVEHVQVLDRDTVIGARGDRIGVIELATDTRRDLGSLGAPIADLSSSGGWALASGGDRLLRTDGTAVETVRTGGPIMAADVGADGTAYAYTAAGMERWSRGDVTTQVIAQPTVEIAGIDAYAADSLAMLAADHSAWRLDLATGALRQIMPTVETSPLMGRDGTCAVAVRDGGVVVADLVGRSWWTLPARDVILATPGPTCQTIFAASMHSDILQWDIDLPYDPAALRDWIEAHTNARASDTHGVIEWALPPS